MLYPDIGVYKIICLSMLRWYKPELHREELIEWMQRAGAEIERSIDCLDMFGASGRVKRCWEEAGYAAEGFDIKINPGHDVCSPQGFKTLLSLGLKLLEVSLADFGEFMHFCAFLLAIILMWRLLLG